MRLRKPAGVCCCYKRRMDARTEDSAERTFGEPPGSWEGQLLGLDRLVHAQTAQFTSGLSPGALAVAYADWWIHLASSPGKQMQLAVKSARKSARWALYAWLCALGDTPPCIEPLPQDRRFEAPAWHHWPYNLIHQAFLLQQQWWHNATTDVEGVTAHHERVVNFFTRQVLDTLAPSNGLLTNPEALEEARRSLGLSLVRGWQLRLRDSLRLLRGQAPAGTERYRAGQSVAITPGKVVASNRLMELIQYSPTTAEVHARPVLIVPSWIMRYYILDLSPQNSLVRQLVAQGHSVFVISWANPQAGDWNWGMDDYLQEGPLAALQIMESIIPGQAVQGVGYCLGGTLLAIAASLLARRAEAAGHSGTAAQPSKLASLTLLAAEIDFTEPGELDLFVDESQLDFIDDLMSASGYLDGKQMAGAFALLNSRDMVWSRLQHYYLMGRDAPVTDLMAWNADATRMPWRMMRQYLRSLFLRNDYVEGRYRALGTSVVPMDIRVPVFALGTEWDSVSPWKSVYKVHLLTETEVTFCLSSRGHNVGVVNPPGPDNPNHYRLRLMAGTDPYRDPDAWYAQTPPVPGSWWPAWFAWLARHAGKRTRPPRMGLPTSGQTDLPDAPGLYVGMP